MDKALIDTSTLIDTRRVAKSRRAPWAYNTNRHLEDYRAIHPVLTVSGLTVFEMLEGMYRDGREEDAAVFQSRFLPSLEIIYPDEVITVLGAEIYAALSKGQTIGIADTLIAATAIARGLTLVTANDAHFVRVQAAGFPLKIENWREP